jgi:hypothetical protein
MERTDWLDDGPNPADARFLMLTASTHDQFSSPMGRARGPQTPCQLVERGITWPCSGEASPRSSARPCRGSSSRSWCSSGSWSYSHSRSHWRAWTCSLLPGGSSPSRFVSTYCSRRSRSGRRSSCASCTGCTGTCSGRSTCRCSASGGAFRSRVGSGTITGVGERDLSGGDRRRLYTASALATPPDVLHVDESTTGLDSSTGTHVLMATSRRLPRVVFVLAMHNLPADLRRPVLRLVRSAARLKRSPGRRP